MLLLLTVTGEPPKMQKTPTPTNDLASTSAHLRRRTREPQQHRERHTHLQGGLKQRSTKTSTLPAPPRRELIFHGAAPKKKASDSLMSPDPPTPPPSAPLHQTKELAAILTAPPENYPTVWLIYTREKRIRRRFNRTPSFSDTSKGGRDEGGDESAEENENHLSRRLALL